MRSESIVNMNAFPEMVFSWYNPVQKKLFKRTLKEITVNVQPNPDLGVLASIRDSLNVLQKESIQESQEKEPFKIFGFSPESFFFVLLIGVLFIYMLFLLAQWLLRLIKIRQEQYRNSEAYYFQTFKKVASRSDIAPIVQALYRWIDELQLREPSVAYFAMKFGTKELQDEVQLMGKEITNRPTGLNLNVKEWQKARKNYLAAITDKTKARITDWINPT